MRNATLYTPFAYGASLLLTSVEASIQRGLPEFRIVGLPDKSVREALVRVKAAIQNSGLVFPQGRVTVNIGPADVPKRGTEFDLAIALAVLAASNRLRTPCVAVGELSLTGQIQPSRLGGLICEYARSHNFPWILAEANPSGSGCVATTLSKAWSALQEESWSSYSPIHNSVVRDGAYSLDSLAGHALPKRVLQIALAGRHPVLLSGPPGVGKSVLVQAFAELMPVLTAEQEAQLATLEAQVPMRVERSAYASPFVYPNNRVRSNTLFGRMNPLQPGLLSLASHGILFLDELPYISQEVLQGLYGVMDSQIINPGQAPYAKLPASPLIIGARNLCGCGRLGDPTTQCICTPNQLRQYERRLPEPLLDRFHLSCEVSMQNGKEKSELTAEQLRQSIAEVHEQKMNVSLTVASKELLSRATELHKLNFRAQAHIRAVSETIAKLDHAAEVLPNHVHEAMQYRVRGV